ncbi:MAG: hypothetical protein ABIH28_02540 [archaeon]
MAIKRKVKRSGSRRAQGGKVKRANVVAEKFISKKIKLTLTSLVFSLIVFAGSWVGYEYFFLENTFLGDFFFTLTLLSKYLSLAFFIALLVFLVLKAFRR